MPALYGGLAALFLGLGLLALGVAGTLWAVAFVLIRATTKVDV